MQRIWRLFSFSMRSLSRRLTHSPRISPIPHQRPHPHPRHSPKGPPACRTAITGRIAPNRHRLPLRCRPGGRNRRNTRTTTRYGHPVRYFKAPSPRGNRHEYQKYRRNRRQTDQATAPPAVATGPAHPGTSHIKQVRTLPCTDWSYRNRKACNDAENPDKTIKP
jgi:hypothetical protein